MTVGEHLDSIKERLVADGWVIAFDIVRERETLMDGYIRVHLRFADSSRLEFSEYVQLATDGIIRVITYSYHWADESGNLIVRWDNTPHHPELAGFPHHVHVGGEGNIVPGRPMMLFMILDEIEQRFTNNPHTPPP